jgi:hypothetical protein
MRIAQLSTARVGSAIDKQTSARDSLVLVFDCLRVWRLTGDCPKDDTYTVGKVTGQEKKGAAIVHSIFKKQDLVDYVLHEVELLSQPLLASVEMFRTPLALVKRFAASGVQGLAANFRSAQSASADGLENALALTVAEYRDLAIQDTKARALIEFLWSLRSGPFDEEIMELCSQDMQNINFSFLWHRYLKESPQMMGVKYRAFVDACTAGPIAAESAAQIFMGTSELTEADMEDLKHTQELLLALRRNTVTFVALPTIGGASGAEYTKAQMEKLWETMRLGHKFSRKKNGRSRVRFVGRPLPSERGQARGGDEHE